MIVNAENAINGASYEMTFSYSVPQCSKRRGKQYVMVLWVVVDNTLVLETLFFDESTSTHEPLLPYGRA